jgi:alanine-synthesizing transaminase
MAIRLPKAFRACAAPFQVVPAPLRRGFDPDREAIVTIGSKEGLAHLMLATLDQGDTVLVPNPSYPIHIWGAVIAGANIRSVRMTPGVDFFDELERAVRESYPKPKMMILGFPSNPTAQCVELEFFERVVALASSTTSWWCTTWLMPISL